MISDKIKIKNIKGFSNLDIDFCFPDSSIIVVTGRNGIGKTSIVKSFNLINDPQVFKKSANLNSVKEDSLVGFQLEGFKPFEFEFNSNLGVLDSKDALPREGDIVAELPVPYGKRFSQFSLVSGYDAEIRSNIAASDYERADDLIRFLSDVYLNDKLGGIKVTKVRNNNFYFILLDDDYYIREDHLSSGEFFLIQIFRLITSGARLVLIDELDVSLDAAAQVNLYGAIKPILSKYDSRLIVISHSLAFMSTVEEGGLYYLESESGYVSLEQRSFGYVKSDLYGFRGKDRFIITEDEVLSGFISYLINNKVSNFFEYEIISVGGKPQIEAIAAKNDSNHIFGDPDSLLIFIDRDISGSLKYKGRSKVVCSPVDDIELFVWENRDRLLKDLNIPFFKPAQKNKDTAKTFWKKILRSKKKSSDDLYFLIESECPDEVSNIVESLKSHLCLRNV